MNAERKYTLNYRRDYAHATLPPVVSVSLKAVNHDLAAKAANVVLAHRVGTDGSIFYTLESICASGGKTGTKKKETKNEKI